jgi:hypothetical protein
MKTSSAAGPRIRKRSVGLNCLLINQFATPGLGSLMARRFVAGTLQLSLALLGFGLFVGSFIQLGQKTYRLVEDLPEQPAPYPWMGQVGMILFVTAWLLSWITSISVLLQERQKTRNETPARPLPPKIAP